MRTLIDKLLEVYILYMDKAQIKTLIYFNIAKSINLLFDEGKSNGALQKGGGVSVWLW